MMTKSFSKNLKLSPALRFRQTYTEQLLQTQQCCGFVNKIYWWEK